MQDLSFHNITTDKLSLPLFTKKDIELSVLRLDKIHPFISGNKWFKLRFYLDEALVTGKKTIITFGGAWSNHIIATAAACKLNGLDAIGMIRGEEATILSPSLMQAKEQGMNLVFISRDDYSRKKIPAAWQSDEYYFINEGGYGIKGAEGAATILNYCAKENYTHICCAAGTGTMMAGLIRGALPSQRIVGISVLKNNPELEQNLRSLLDDQEKNFHLVHDYHFGGYAKYTKKLIVFMNDFYSRENIPSDFVYTGKLFYAIEDLLKNNFFPPGSKLLLIHSGGLQGNISLGRGTLIF
jgi:1-aminocyclopropane-1-carboxylate deaminase